MQKRMIAGMQVESSIGSSAIPGVFSKGIGSRMILCSNDKCKQTDNCSRARKDYVNHLSTFKEFDLTIDSCFKPKRRLHNKRLNKR
jgi:hypothetical protein